MKSEGLRLVAYLCPADKWTIGYGHTGSDVKPGLRIATVVNRAIRDTDFDPIDLAQLASGWTWPEPMSTAPLGIEDSEFLVEVARMLHRLWQEVGEQWSGVWAYDIADPLGGWLSRNGINHETADGVARAEQQARAWIAEGMGAAR